jgi:hypothetical protein
MDFGSLIQDLVGIQEEEPTPKWLVGQRACPMMIGEDLFWRMGQLIMRGLPPDGVRLSHEWIHKVPSRFGPIGTPKQVVPGAPLLGGVVPFQTELGETLTFAIGKLVKFVGRDCNPLFFAYPPVDDKPQLIAAMQIFGKTEDEKPRFRLYAFIAPATQNIHHFLLPEHQERLPRFDGLDFGDDHGMVMEEFPYGGL